MIFEFFYQAANLGYLIDRINIYTHMAHK